MLGRITQALEKMCWVWAEVIQSWHTLEYKFCTRLGSAYPGQWKEALRRRSGPLSSEAPALWTWVNHPALLFLYQIRDSFIVQIFIEHLWCVKETSVNKTDNMPDLKQFIFQCYGHNSCLAILLVRRQQVQECFVSCGVPVKGCGQDSAGLVTQLIFSHPENCVPPTDNWG